jgi:hypothetical protein
MSKQNKKGKDWKMLQKFRKEIIAIFIAIIAICGSCKFWDRPSYALIKESYTTYFPAKAKSSLYTSEAKEKFQQCIKGEMLSFEVTRYDLLSSGEMEVDVLVTYKLPNGSLINDASFLIFEKKQDSWGFRTSLLKPY